jgi:hypothetical protein
MAERKGIAANHTVFHTRGDGLWRGCLPRRGATIPGPSFC